MTSPALQREARTFDAVIEGHIASMRNPLLVMAEAGADHYRRSRDLPKCDVAFWPEELSNYTPSGTRHIIAKLAARSTALHQLALRRHWSYDTNKHLAVVTAIIAEKRRLEAWKEGGTK